MGCVWLLYTSSTRRLVAMQAFNIKPSASKQRIALIEFNREEHPVEGHFDLWLILRQTKTGPLCSGAMGFSASCYAPYTRRTRFCGRYVLAVGLTERTYTSGPD
jgi:hypothetical protein